MVVDDSLVGLSVYGMENDSPSTSGCMKHSDVIYVSCNVTVGHPT